MRPPLCITRYAKRKPPATQKAPKRFAKATRGTDAPLRITSPYSELITVRNVDPSQLHTTAALLGKTRQDLM